MHLVCYLRDGDRVFETYWTTRRGVEAMDYSYALMDLTVYGRQEPWEDSPPGWPQQWQVGRLACGSTDAPSPSGRDSKLDALTTSPLGPDRRWRGELLNAEPSFRRLKGHRQMDVSAARTRRASGDRQRCNRCEMRLRPPERTLTSAGRQI